MTLTFVGTGAADWDWQSFPPGTRGACATLVGSSCLIDCGTATPRNLAAAGIRPAAVRNLLVTHAHPDHFRPDAVAELARAARRTLRVWASPLALAELPDGPFEKRPLEAGRAFRAGAARVTALPANHFVRAGDASFHFLVVAGGRRLLYATDGAWMLAEEKRLLAAALKGAPLDAVVWDATRGATPDDYRFADHNNLKMIDALRLGMEGCGLAAPATRHVFTHISRQLWPRTPSARRRLAERHGGLLAEDGLTLSV